MAKPLPINELPFQGDCELKEWTMPDGTVAILTKAKYFDRILADWYQKATEFAALKAAEAEARARVIEMVYPDGYAKPGTDKFGIQSGWVLEMERRINVSIDEAQLAGIAAEVAKLEVDPDTGEIPTFSAAVKPKPTFSEAGYRDLREDVKALLNDALTFTPGTAGVKVIPPKAKATARVTDQKAKAKGAA